MLFLFGFITFFLLLFIASLPQFPFGLLELEANFGDGVRENRIEAGARQLSHLRGVVVEEQVLAQQIDLLRPRARSEHVAEVDVDDGEGASVDHDVGEVAVGDAEDVAEQDRELHRAQEDLSARVEGVFGVLEEIASEIRR